MTKDKLIQNYVDNLEEEFVANQALWTSSMNIANAALSDINKKYDTRFVPISYNSFCIDARAHTKEFLHQCNLERVLILDEEEVLRFSPELNKLEGEEFEQAYLEAARNLHKNRVVELQISLHRYCIKACLKKRAPEQYKRFAVILESTWDLHQQSNMQ